MPEPFDEEPMAAVQRAIASVARGTESVLLFGEIGAGKSFVAERIHRASPRADKPFLTVKCGAMPAGLLEAELFGDSGLIAAAAGGTLFLDEVSDLPRATQQRLLAAIQHLDDVRFVAATSAELEALIEAGSFLRELHTFLNGTRISIPPLRERRSEIADLAQRFVDEERERMGRRSAEISEAARGVLLAHPWPGNVRELKTVAERAALLAADAIGVEHLIFPSAAATVPPPAVALITASLPGSPRVPSDVAGDRQRTLETLKRCGGDRMRAAAELGISRSKLLRHLDEWGLGDDGSKE